MQVTSKLPTSPVDAESAPSPAKKLPLTHFVCLPIGHHPALRESWTRISKALIDSSPAIPGLHESIIVKPGSLHLTLGVLSLVRHEPRPSNRGSESVVSENKASYLSSSSQARHTIEDALRLLRTLEVPIRNMLNEGGLLTVPLERIDVMRSRPNQKLEQSHVMWAGPDLDSEAGQRLSRACHLIHTTFKNAGMLQDDRPLKLHCTLINTLYRKEKETGNQKDRRHRNKKRIPFSFAGILSSATYRQIASPISGVNDALTTNHGSYRVELGSWTVDEVQLCEMGSKDADGVYRNVGSITLHGSR